MESCNILAGLSVENYFILRDDVNKNRRSYVYRWIFLHGVNMFHYGNDLTPHCRLLSNSDQSRNKIILKSKIMILFSHYLLCLAHFDWPVQYSSPQAMCLCHVDYEESSPPVHAELSRKYSSDEFFSLIWQREVSLTALSGSFRELSVSLLSPRVLRTYSHRGDDKKCNGLRIRLAGPNTMSVIERDWPFCSIYRKHGAKNPNLIVPVLTSFWCCIDSFRP